MTGVGPRGILSRMFRPLFAFAALLAVPLSTDASVDPDLPVATASGPVEVTAEVERLRRKRAADGEVRLRFAPAGKVRAGEELHYTIRVRNSGPSAVREVQVTKRLPFGLRYVEGSAVGPSCRTEFSVDGGERFAAPAALRVAPPGQSARAALVGDYTHVRWLLQRPLAPGATALLRFRAHFE